MEKHHDISAVAITRELAEKIARDFAALGARGALVGKGQTHTGAIARALDLGPLVGAAAPVVAEDLPPAPQADDLPALP